MAISSSCGALDNIVVDTIDTAQKCVTFLKEQNIGVATFIGLDKVKVLPTAGISAQTHRMKRVFGFFFSPLFSAACLHIEDEEALAGYQTNLTSRPSTPQ